MTGSIPIQRSYDILLVEDSEDDAILTQYAFRDVPVQCNLHVVSDGVEALAFLRREAPHANAPRPHIILLDLNMPRMDGREFLAEIKEDEDLKLIPTVILTTSSAESDIEYAYRAHAAAYMTKPFGLDVFSRKIRSFVDFWLTETVRLPCSASAI